METMRELLRGALRQTLHAMRDEDKLAAAWTIACGRAMAERGVVNGYEDGLVRVEVASVAWLRQMMSMREQLAREMARIAGVKVTGINFELKRNDSR